MLFSLAYSSRRQAAAFQLLRPHGNVVGIHRPGTAKTFKGHESWVFSAAFAPPARQGEKETRIVTASQDGTVMVWSIATQRPDPPFQGHAGPVYAARFSPDGRFVASAGYDKRVLLWRPEDVKPFNYEILRSDREPPPPIFESLEGHTAAISSLEFSPNGKFLASGGHDNTVCVWDVDKRKLLKTLRGHAGWVRLWPSPQLPDVEAQLLTGSHDQSAKISKPERLRGISRLRGAGICRAPGRDPRRVVLAR